MKNNADVLDSPPRVAGTLPPKFQRVFVESTLSDAEWLRLPLPSDRCPLTGLSRTTLIELGDRGEIVMKRIRKPGATRGIVILHKQSLLDYLYRLPPEGEQVSGQNGKQLATA
jgi:hypothetical protein